MTDDAQTRLEKRRTYMRELMRERRARARGNDGVPAVSTASSVSTDTAVSTPEPVSTPVSSTLAVSPGAQPSAPNKPRVVFRPAVYPPTGLTPMVKARAKKVFPLFAHGGTKGEREAARLRLHDMATRAGVPVAELLTAIGAPSDALEVPHA
jgi:hypothetical protein